MQHIGFRPAGQGQSLSEEKSAGPRRLFIINIWEKLENYAGTYEQQTNTTIFHAG